MPKLSPSSWNQPCDLSPNFQTFKEPRNRFQGINSARLCSLAGRYDNTIPTRFLAPIDCSKIYGSRFKVRILTKGSWSVSGSKSKTLQVQTSNKKNFCGIRVNHKYKCLSQFEGFLSLGESLNAKKYPSLKIMHYLLFSFFRDYFGLPIWFRIQSDPDFFS